MADRFVALLRGINLGSHNKIPMPALRQVMQSLNFIDVQTYLQSGNVVYRTESAAPVAEIEAAISTQINEVFGLDIPVIVRSGPELQSLAAANPFLPGAESRFLHVTFLDGQWDGQGTFNREVYKPDEFEVSDKNIYLHTPGGYGRSKLSNAFWERASSRRATTRNWNTVAALAAMVAD